jgi:dienelactone hydrolase
MAEVIVFHHALGLTEGIGAFADELRAAGHSVHAPDLYEGRTFGTVDEGVDHAREIGFGNILERGRAAVEGLPNELVYAGFSLGVMPAQDLAQTRPGAKGALFFHAAMPPSGFESEWPKGVAVQIHIMEGDNAEGDVDVAREFAATVGEAELFLYAGDEHLFMDHTLPSYDETAATLATQRALWLLDGVT